ncbi:putative carboxypeptidase D [Helianthus annuus]|nr:putative carboxypeptidase D [Helianthus annuus]
MLLCLTFFFNVYDYLVTCSGDTDSSVPVTTTKYAIKKLNTTIKTPWYPWYLNDEVGGFAVVYENLTFVTVRGAGHFIPSFKPDRALALFSSFLDFPVQNKISVLPPS